MREIRGTRRQVEAAALSGMAQPKISRAERGHHTFTRAEAETYAAALGATPKQTADLVELAEVAEMSHLRGQARLVRRGPEIQRRIWDLERASALLQSWQPTVIPGLLQSWDYTLACIERDPAPAWVEARRARLALLDDPDRQFRQIFSEAALRWGIGSRKVMADQARHLVELADRPNIEIGVVPFGQIIVPPPEGTFHLYSGDDEADPPVPAAAVVATEAGTTFLHEPDDLDRFTALFDRLATIAVYGDDARRLIERATRAR